MVSMDESGSSSTDVLPAEVGLIREIRCRRIRAGLSQAEPANRVGYSHEYVSRAERPGRGLPSGELVGSLDDALHADGALVAMHAVAHDERLTRRGPEVRIRPASARKVVQSATHTEQTSADIAASDLPELLTGKLCVAGPGMVPTIAAASPSAELLQLGTIATGAVAPNALLLEFAASSVGWVEMPEHIRRSDIDDLRDSVAMIESWDNVRGGGMARAALSGQIRYAADLLKVDCAPRDRPDLFAAVGALARTAGFVLFDSSDYPAAQRHFQFALLCAHEADDWQLRAATYASMARQDFWAGNLDSALTLVEMALVRSDRLDYAERAMLTALTARATAGMGDRKRTLTAVADADELLAQAGPDARPNITSYDAAEHVGETGHALADLMNTGDPASADRIEDAATRLRSAAAGHGPRFARSRAFCELRLATLMFDAGRVEEAVTVGELSLGHAATVRSRRLAIVAAGLDRAAAAYPRSPGVAELRDRVTEFRR